jgi:hypothetical protein
LLERKKAATHWAAALSGVIAKHQNADEEVLPFSAQGIGPVRWCADYEVA